MKNRYLVGIIKRLKNECVQRITAAREREREREVIRGEGEDGREREREHGGEMKGKVRGKNKR